MRKNGKTSGVLAPRKKQLYWRGPVEVRVAVYDGEDLALNPRVAKVLVCAKQPLAAQVADAVSAAEVRDIARRKWVRRAPGIFGRMPL